MKDIEDWIEKLNAPERIDGERERAVMQAIRSGLASSAAAEPADAVGLRRLHARLEREGLYARKPQPRGRNLQRYSWAAVIVLGLGITLEWSVFDESLKRDVMAPGPIAPVMDEDRTEAETEPASQPMVSEATKAEGVAPPAIGFGADRADSSRQPEVRERRQSGRVAEEQDAIQTLEQDALPQLRSAPKASATAADIPTLTLTQDQWTRLQEVAGDQLQRSGDSWVLRLNSAQHRTDWLAALPAPYRSRAWPVDQPVRFRLELAND